VQRGERVIVADDDVEDCVFALGLGMREWWDMLLRRRLEFEFECRSGVCSG
jgi:hypothetical protein